VQQGQVVVFKLFDFGSACPIHDAKLCKHVDNRSFLTMIMSVLTWDLFPRRTTKKLVLSDDYEPVRSKEEEAPMFELFPWLAEPVEHFAEANGKQIAEIFRVPRTDGGVAECRFPSLLGSRVEEVVVVTMGPTAVPFWFADMTAVI
jgi:hypothetical protein